MKMKQIVLFILLISLTVQPMKAQTYDSLWKKIEQAQNKSLPQTVQSLATQIYDKASAERNMGQMLKAYITRMEYQDVIVPDSFYVNLQNLVEMEQSLQDPVDKSILNSLLMSFYEEYANMNEMQLRRRTALAEDEAPADIRLWTTNLFSNEILKRGLASIQDKELLFKTSSANFEPFVTEGKSSRYYKHNMYQLLASRAISSFGDMQWAPQESIFAAKIDSIYQQLLSQYKESGLSDGYILTAIDCAKWKHELNTVEPIMARVATQLPKNDYVDSLDELLKLYPTNELCAEVYSAKARYAIRLSQPSLALQFCDEAIKRYPKYNRINELRNIRQQILQPVLNALLPSQVYPDAPLSISVDYKNVTGFTVQFLQNNKVVSSQKVSLQSTDDYLMCDSTIQVTAPGLGEYSCEVIPFGTNSKKNKDTNPISVSRLNILTLGLPNNQCEIVVLDALSGQPVSDATIELFDNKSLVETITTNANGSVIIDFKNEYKSISAKKGDDIYMPSQRFYRGSFLLYNTSNQVTEKVQLITDRTIYRPGQTVYVKGIAYSQKNDTASVIPNKEYTLTLFDANYQEVAKKQLTTNEFGSFTTEFILPDACLNGSFRLTTDKGSTNIQVEEYKLPTFEVIIDKPTTSYHLGDTVELKGVAKSLNGVPMQELPVKYTINRTENRWWFSSLDDDDIITSGSVLLNEDGSFIIPVPLVAPSDQGTYYYSYNVKASITSLSGETQSANFAINAGSRSMILNADIPELICKENMADILIKAVNLDSQPLQVSGSYKLYSVTDTMSEAEATKGVVVLSGTFNANQPLSIKAWDKLPSGKYVIVYTANDNQGREVSDKDEFVIFSLTDKRPPIKIDTWYYPVTTEFDSAHPAVFYYGTSYNDTFVMMKVFSGTSLIDSQILHLSDTIERFEFDYKESYGDGLVVLFCFVKEGKTYQQKITLSKKQPDRNLTMKWDVFRDKLRPGQKEEWKLTIKTPTNQPANAEMLALMYDAALDRLYPNNQVLRVYYPQSFPKVDWRSRSISNNHYNYTGSYKYLPTPEMEFDAFYNVYNSILSNQIVVAYGVRSKKSLSSRTNGVNAWSDSDVLYESNLNEVVEVEDNEGGYIDDEGMPTDELRTNFAETAFFYPQLRTNEQGEVVLSFIMPESLTRWTFKGFSHTKGMFIGNLDASATTSKEFMIMPNMPRFVRVGDDVTIAATITNLTNKTISGTSSMALFNPLNDRVISTQKQSFTVEAGKTTAVSFSFKATDKYEILGCRMIADGGTFSDGEQRAIPVLSDKIHLTESVAMPIRGNESRTFSLQHLFNNHSATATNRSLTIEYTANPVWYAVQALPAIALPDNNSAISWATAYYANSLASWIMEQQPRIKTMFDTWKQQGGTKETLLSNLQKNQELKSIILAESPWVLEAKTEQEQMQRIATLFDINNVRNNNITALTRLKELQQSNGAWSWYKGMNSSQFVTQYIAELNARLALLTNQPLSGAAESMQKTAMDYLHQQMYKSYQEMTEKQRNSYQLSYSALKYLYLVAISNEQVPSENTKVYNFYLSKIGNLLPIAGMSEKAMAAIILNKQGNNQKANQFMASIKEHLVTSNELGMYFAFNESPYNWNGLQIPTHVLVMEAFNTVSRNTAVVDEMKLWLLKQKQTQSWDSPVASANAIYALLMTGSNLLENEGQVKIQIGNKTINTSKANATPGLGYIKEVFTSKQVIDATKATVTKQDAGIGWGAAYAQYEEQISEVNQQGGELNVDKKLYVERIVNNQKQLVPITTDTKLAIGDIVVSRLAITLDRAMDFIQLKDQRAACFEPIASVSGYRWGNGFGYYVDIKDASTSFFFDGLGKGVFVLEYSYRVSRAGQYQSGIATIQSAYAPEFSSHSSSMLLHVAD